MCCWSNVSSRLNDRRLGTRSIDYRIDIPGENSLENDVNRHSALIDERRNGPMKDKPKEYDLGVLLVHGIGTQLCGETLVRWGDVLVKTIGSATRNRVQVEVRSAGHASDAARDSLTTAVLTLRSSSGQEKPWLLVDGWWADVFLPPSYRELVSWSVRALPWAIAFHIAQRFWAAAQHNKTGPKFFQMGIAIFELLIGLAIAPVFVVLLALTAVLGLLPIPQIRSFIRAAQGTLVSTVGDCLAFVESPIRAAMIRTRILARLEWLKEQCEYTIIVAHSQGAAVVMDALGALREPVQNDLPQLESEVQSLAPDTLVTFGAGTNQLASLTRLSAGLPEKVGMKNPVTYAIGALFGCLGISVWLGVALFLHQTNPMKILFATGVFGIFGVASWLLPTFALKLASWLGKHWDSMKTREKQVATITFTILFLPLLGYFIWLVQAKGLPLFQLSFVPMALIGLIGAISVILSQKMRDVLTIVPPKVDRWYDFYASEDPVPNGPTLITEPESEKRKSNPISNLGSFFADHTSYWDNLDGFVLPVVRVCAETGKSSWQNQLPRESPEVDKRAAWRVRLLRLARAIVCLSWLVTGAALWFFHANAIPLLFKPAGWLPAIAVTMTRLATLSVAMIVAAWVSSRIVQFVWGCWVRKEQRRVLGHQAVENRGFWALVGMYCVVWAVIALAYCAATDRVSNLISARVLKDIEDIVPAILGLAGMTAFVATWLRPGPRVPGSNTD